MKRTILFFVFMWLFAANANATTCANATAITLGTTTLTCGTTNDISGIAGCGSTSYMGGTEALYTFVPAYSEALTIQYTGQTWTGIFVWAGCPTAGGVCVGTPVTSSAASKSMVVNVTAGVTYYIMFDTWPSPPSPCPGTAVLSMPPPPPPCSGVPDIPVAAISASSGCPSVNFTLSASGFGAVTGLTYQWESSPTGSAPWSPIAGATSSSYVTSSATTMSYRLVSTCAGSGQSSASNVVSYSLSAPNITLASISSTNGCANTNFTLSTSQTIPTGAVLQWLSSPTGNAPWTPIPGANTASFTASTSTTMSYRLSASCAAGGQASLTNIVTYTVTIPTITIATISSTSGCANANFTLSTSQSTPTNFTYQWQSSPTGNAPWTPVVGGTTANFTTSTATTMSYRLVSTCAGGGLSTTTSVVTYTVGAGNPCACGSYANNFASSSADTDISSVTVGNMTNNQNTCSVAAPGPGSIAGRYANFTGSVTGPNATVGAIVPFTIVQSSCSGNNYPNIIQIYVDWNQDGVFDISERMYESTLATNVAPGVSGTFTVPPTANIGTTRMRIVCAETTVLGENYAQSAAFSWGETEDYCFSVVSCLSPIASTTTVGSTTATIGWTATAGAVDYDYEVRTSGAAGSGSAGLVASGTTASLSASITSLFPLSSYSFYIRTNCSVSNQSFWSPALPFTTTCIGPLSGTYTLDASLPFSLTNFTSFGQLFNFLNTCGVSDAVIVNVAAGQVFEISAPLVALTATGTSTNTITIQKSGSGANPKIVAANGIGTVDAIIDIFGGSYISFDGIDVEDSPLNANTTTQYEYGYRIRNASATVGAQYNVVKNCKVTLNPLRTTAIGVLVSSNATPSGTTPTAQSGATNNNTIQGVTVESAGLGGILVTNGSTTLPGDNNKVIGCTIGKDYSGLPNNTSIGGGSSVSAYGIYFLNQNAGVIDNNTVRNLLSSAGTNRGIWVASATGTTEIKNNVIFGIRNSSTSSVSTQRGIEAGLNGSTTAILGTAAHQMRIYNNMISDISSAYTGAASSTRVLTGIILVGGGNVTSSYNIDFNSISIDGSASPNVSSVCLELGGSTGASQNIRNNIFANYTGAQTGVAKHYCIRSTAAASIGTGSVSDYNDFYIANATNGFVALTNTTDQATIAAWDAAITTPAAPIDANSVSIDPKFTDHRFDLHASDNSDPVNNIGNYLGITWVTEDIDGEVRSLTTPDIGADEHSPTLACKRPETAVASAINSNGATLSWGPPSVLPAVGYQYYYSTSDTPPSSTTTPTGSTLVGVNAVTVTGLTTGVTYYFWVRSNCGSGSFSAWNNATSFTTFCGEPLALAASGVTTTNATLTWNSPSPGAPITYTYELRLFGAAGSGSSGLVSSGTNSTGTVSFTTLTPNSHTFYVRSNCSGGAESGWVQVAFTTPCSIPAISVTGTNGGDFCGNGILTATGAETYVWSPANLFLQNTGSTVVYIGTGPATVTVLGTDIYGCSNVGTFVVNSVVPADPITLTATETEFCGEGGTTTISASSTGSYTYSWSVIGGSAVLSGGTATSINATVTQTTTILAIGNNSVSGCQAIQVISIGVYPLPQAILVSSENDVCPGTPSVISSGLSAGNFSVAPIPFAATPAPSNAGVVMNNGVAVLTLGGGSMDDGGWSGIPIGFNFNFFGSSFSEIAVGTNGLLMFGPVPGFGIGSGQLGQYSFVGPPVFPNAGNPGNVIALMAGDLQMANSTSGSIKYWVEGYAPNRIFVLEYRNVHGFSSNPKATVQCRMYETIGVVEIHILEKTFSNACTVGLQDATKTIGAIAPGRTGTWTVTSPEAWRFSPPANYTTAWTATDASGSSVVSSGTNIFEINVVPDIPTTYSLSYTNQTTGCVNAPGSAQVLMNVFGPCAKPQNLVAGITTLNSVPLSWNKVCTETTWDVHVTPIGGGTPTGAPSHPGLVNDTSTAIAFVIGGLTSGTSYHAYVRSNCGPNGPSEWLGPVAFTTLLTNDDCSGAIVLGSCTGTPQQRLGTTIHSTIDANYTNCGAGAIGTGQRGVWYKYVGDNNEVTVNTCGSTIQSFDTRITVYSGSCSNLTCVGGNDDFASCGISGSLSSVTFNAFAGTDYYIFVHSADGTTGDFVLNWICTPCPAPYAVTVTNPTYFGAQVNWQTFSSGAANIEYGLAGFTPGTGTVVTDNASPNVLSGLLVGRNYELYITSNCSGSGAGLSVTKGPIAFSTRCPDLVSYPSLCIDNGPFTLYGGTPAGGTYSGPGVSGGVFNPAVAGVGTHTITYTIAGTNACPIPTTTTIKVNPLPVLTLVPFGNVCIGVTPYAISNFSPQGGTYSGPGIIGGTIFNPALAGLGQHTLVYTYTDANGCVNSSSGIINITPLPITTLAVQAPVCGTLGGPVALTGGAPAGGTYSGPGVINNMFHPDIAGVGIHTIVYTYSLGPGCATSASRPKQVYSVPAPNAGPDFSILYGTNGQIVTTTTGGSGLYSYSWSPADSLINPNAQSPFTKNLEVVNTFTVAVTDLQSGCIGYDTITVNITGGPLFLQNSGDVTICQGESATLYALPSGGTENYQYFWTPSTYLSNPYDSLVIATPPVTTTYQILLFDGFNYRSNYVTVNVLPLPSVGLNNFNALCASASAFTLTGGQPAGGTYSGVGVSGGMFDPAVAGVGTHTITYTITNAQGCSNSASKTITINAMPSVEMANFTNVCLDNGPIMLTNGSPFGGSYSGTGVGNGVFYPSVAGVGMHTITYSYTDANGCGGTASKTIEVYDLPTVSMTSLGSVCVDALPVVLSTGTPTGGSYSGNGVSNGEFIPALAGVGIHTITYSYADANGCARSATGTVTVTPIPSVNLGNFASVCVNSSSMMLSGGNPAGGTYSGPGVSAGMFNPTAAGVGSHTITYTYTDAQGCSNSASKTITVLALPTLTFGSIANVCQGSAQFTLSTAFPLGGTYSGTGVSNGKFNPVTAGVGTHTITYTFTNAAGCTNTATQTVTVNALPTVSFATLNAVCASAAPFALTGGNPTGGNYTGPGVSAGIFHPSQAGPGTHTITYTYTDVNGCSNSATRTIVVNALPVVNVAPVPNQCANSGNLTLNFGTPAGGTYSGPGVSGTTFNPATAGQGNHILTYSVTNANGCSSSTTFTIVVNAAPTVTMGAVSPLCITGAPIQLLTGQPGGGTYSGTGVSGGVFNPQTAGVGNHTVTYTFTNAAGCTATATQTISVVALPVVNLNNYAPVCKDAPAFTLSGGTPAGGVYSGPGVFNGMFYPSIVAPGTYSITYTYTSAAGCVNTDAGSITVNPLPAQPFITQVSTVLTANSVGAVSYQWLDANQNPIPGATAQTYTATGNGVFYVQITDANGCSSTSARFIVDFTGIEEELANGMDVQIYPNPNNGVFTLDILGAYGQEIGVTITDAVGKVVQKFDIPVDNMDKLSRTIDLSGYSKGVYLITVNTDNRMINKKVVVQ